MAGCRSLTELETVLVMDQLHSKRDQALFILGLKTGYRISELLSLKISDVYDSATSQVLARIRVQKRNVKGKTASREVAVHPLAKEAILSLVQSHSTIDGATFLFKSRNGVNEPISRHGAHKVLKQAYAAAGLSGSLATHTMRKTFAGKVYKALSHDLNATKEALGHSSILNTVKYLAVNQDEIDQAVLSA